MRARQAPAAQCTWHELVMRKSPFVRCAGHFLGFTGFNAGSAASHVHRSLLRMMVRRPNLRACNSPRANASYNDVRPMPAVFAASAGDSPSGSSLLSRIVNFGPFMSGDAPGSACIRQRTRGRYEGSGPR